MTPTQFLHILKLLSALESWAFSVGKPLPDYLHDDLTTAMDVIQAEILKGKQ
jgi:hypothetical protein